MLLALRILTLAIAIHCLMRMILRNWADSLIVLVTLMVMASRIWRYLRLVLPVTLELTSQAMKAALHPPSMKIIEVLF